ncbi:MAG: hypothetical protein ACOC56_06835, partial [Atribacterota bacterium]
RLAKENGHQDVVDYLKSVMEKENKKIVEGNFGVYKRNGRTYFGWKNLKSKRFGGQEFNSDNLPNQESEEGDGSE